MFKQTMVTMEGKRVLAGVYRFYETHGLPLDVVFQLIDEQGCMVDWLDFYVSALRGGMKHDRIVSKIADALSDADVFTMEIRQQILKGLQEIGPRIRLK